MDKYRLLNLIIIIVIFMFVIAMFTICFSPNNIPVHFNAFGVGGIGSCYRFGIMPYYFIIIKKL